MWWSRRRSAALAALGVLTLLLGGCGFQPLYGGGSGQQTMAQLATIEVEAMTDRVGYDLRNHLIDRLAPEGAAPVRYYRLKARTTTAKEALALQFDDSTTRFNLRLTVEFDLVDITSAKILYSDQVSVLNSFNVLNEDYSTLTSEIDAERRAARQAADEIRTLLSVFFSRHVGS